MTPRRTPAGQAIQAAATPMAEQIIYGIQVRGMFRLAMSVQDAADVAGMTLHEVWGAIERGELRSTGHGRIHRITAQDLLSYLGLLPGQEGRKTA